MYRVNTTCIVQAVSRERSRPTREETRRRLFDAAAEVFARDGIGLATVDDISTAAGFTRGAFYSNFDSKDALVFEMLDEHLEQSVHGFEEMLSDAPTANPLDLLAGQRDRRNTAIDRSGLLYTDYVLYAAGLEEGRRRLRARLDLTRQTIAQALDRAEAAFGVDLPMPSELAAELLVAVDDGYGLHMVIDPVTNTTDRYDQILLHLFGTWAGST